MVVNKYKIGEGWQVIRMCKNILLVYWISHQLGGLSILFLHQFTLWTNYIIYIVFKVYIKTNRINYWNLQVLIIYTQINIINRTIFEFLIRSSCELIIEQNVINIVNIGSIFYPDVSGHTIIVLVFGLSQVRYFKTNFICWYSTVFITFLRLFITVILILIYNKNEHKYIL